MLKFLQFFAALTAISLTLEVSTAQRTNFINWISKVQTYAEPEWFYENVPFVEFPDSEIEEIYYYRWSSHKRHLRYTVPGAGYSVTEFVHKVFYAGKFDTINAAAGHHLYESRWMRNRRFVQDYVNFWAREGGRFEYSEWIADAAWNAFLVDGDVDFILSQQEYLVQIYENWMKTHFDAEVGLFFLSPHWDAMEYSCSSLPTNDPYHGGVGYRPSFNSEMYANALAITKIAELNGDSETAEKFRERAQALRKSVNEKLWDPERKFFYHVFREDNPNLDWLESREEIGFFPWRWQVPDNRTDPEAAWSQLWDKEAFNVEFGPTTCEKRSRYYEGEQPVGQCCWWNGNSWPYSTGMTLNALASLLRNYQPIYFATVGDYVDLLKKYAHTQYKNGKPYVAECHSPEEDKWTCDNRNHSEHYAHSTYTDNILSDLVGIQPQPGNILLIHPLVPNSWSFFAVENLKYHGHEIAIIWDADGSHYNTGTRGLQVYVNGGIESWSPTLSPLTVNIPAPLIAKGKATIENYAANVEASGYPLASASFNGPDSSPWHAVDGRMLYDFVPSNRWSNWGSGTPTDWFQIDFGPGRVKSVSSIDLYIYSDVATGDGGVDCPTSITVQYLHPTTAQWQPVPNPTHRPTSCKPNTKNSIAFTQVFTQVLRITFERDLANDYYVGITEVEIWAPWPQAPSNVYEAEDGFLLGVKITESSSASSGSHVTEISTTDSAVEFTGVWADSAAVCAVTIRYSNSDSAVQTLNVNNLHFQDVQYPSVGPGGFADVTIQVPLSRGNNALIFKRKEKSVDLDKIEVNCP